jgi:hypothetical protein
VIVGFTGHQQLGDVATAAWVRSAIRGEVQRVGITVGLSCLAAGSDQLFADVLIDEHLAHEAVIPCAGYESTFGSESLKTFERLLRLAARIHRLPFDAPSEEAFLAAGKWIVMQCQVLVAVWNGLPARGLGGTGDVVGLARAERRPLVHINPVEHRVYADP